MDGYRLCLTIDGTPPLNSADGKHWRAKRKIKVEWHARIKAAIGRDKPKEPLQYARVTITRCSSKACDGDNLYHSGKYVLDGLVKAGVLADDGPQYIGMPIMRWEKAHPKHAATRVHVMEVAMHELDMSAWNWGE